MNKVKEQLDNFIWEYLSGKTTGIDLIKLGWIFEWSRTTKTITDMFITRKRVRLSSKFLDEVSLESHQEIIKTQIHIIIEQLPPTLITSHRYYIGYFENGKFILITKRNRLTDKYKSGLKNLYVHGNKSTKGKIQVLTAIEYNSCNL